MDMINMLGDTICEKAKELKENIALRGQIATCEEVIEKNYREIGRSYYEQYGDTQDAEFGKQCRAINNAMNGVKELKKQLRK